MVVELQTNLKLPPSSQPAAVVSFSSGLWDSPPFSLVPASLSGVRQLATSTWEGDRGVWAAFSIGALGQESLLRADSVPRGVPPAPSKRPLVDPSCNVINHQGLLVFDWWHVCHPSLNHSTTHGLIGHLTRFCKVGLQRARSSTDEKPPKNGVFSSFSAQRRHCSGFASLATLRCGGNGRPYVVGLLRSWKTPPPLSTC